MNSDQYHAIHRWFEYSADLRRREYERRHARAAILGGLTALTCVVGLVYLFG